MHIPVRVRSFYNGKFTHPVFELNNLNGFALGSDYRSTSGACLGDAGSTFYCNQVDLRKVKREAEKAVELVGDNCYSLKETYHLTIQPSQLFSLGWVQFAGGPPVAEKSVQCLVYHKQRNWSA